MSAIQFKLAKVEQLPKIWEIFEDAIERRRLDGSNQWQNGYPNPDVIKQDIEAKNGYILCLEDEIIGYAAVIFNDEPAYDSIDGKWLSTGDFVVLHRIVISKNHAGKNLSAKIMECAEFIAKDAGIKSLKVDTNFDNHSMIKILEKCGFQLCGEVLMKGSPRQAYEKIVNQKEEL